MGLEKAASRAYKVAEGTDTAAVQGAQQIISLLPICLKNYNSVAILGPTYNEYEKAFKSSGIKAQTVSDVSKLSSSDIAIIVNPNNPTGKVIAEEILDDLSKKVRILIIDESFKMFSSRRIQKFDNVIQINSLGKFFGLAGVRLGFVSGPSDFIKSVRGMLGPWPVSSVAAEIGIIALNDKTWISAMEKILLEGSNVLHEACSTRNWKLVGKTNESTSSPSITRINRKRAINITADIDISKANSNEIVRNLENDFLPKLLSDYPYVSYSLEGEQREQNENLESLGNNYVLALFLVYILLAIPFKSYICLLYTSPSPRD